MRCIVSYYPSTRKIYNVYHSMEDARQDVKMYNLFSGDREKLAIAELPVTEAELTGELEDGNSHL